MLIAAPAKVNLTLEVLDRRDDGYHALRSVIVPISLHDTLTIEAAPSFAFSCNNAALENDDNLVVRAVRAIAPNATNRIALRKEVPSQAGLGGGSSDAAAVLLAAMEGAFGTISAHDWVHVARKLGSDVPFFLAQSGALVEGTGERVTSLGALPNWHVLVVKPPVAISTAAAFAKIDQSPRPSRPRSSSVSLAMVEAVQRRHYDRAIELLSNDFHDVITASAPEIAATLEALRAAGATKPLLSGSGSAVFALEQDAARVDAIATNLSLPETYARFKAQIWNSGSWR